jgi:hypothetical protein
VGRFGSYHADVMQPAVMYLPEGGVGSILLSGAEMRYGSLV